MTSLVFLMDFLPCPIPFVCHAHHSFTSVRLNLLLLFIFCTVVILYSLHQFPCYHTRCQCFYQTCLLCWRWINYATACVHGSERNLHRMGFSGISSDNCVLCPRLLGGVLRFIKLIYDIDQVLVMSIANIYSSMCYLNWHLVCPVTRGLLSSVWRLIEVTYEVYEVLAMSLINIHLLGVLFGYESSLFCVLVDW